MSMKDKHTRIKKKKKRSIGLLKGKLRVSKGFYDPLPDDIVSSFEGNTVHNKIKRRFDTLKSKIRISKDFDDPLPDDIIASFES